MTTSLLELDTKKADKDAEKRRNVSLLDFRRDWAIREVAPIVKSELCDEAIRLKLGNLTSVWAKDSRMSIDEGSYLRVSSRSTIHTIVGKDEHKQESWGEHWRDCDLWSYTLMIRSGVQGVGTVFFTVAAVDDVSKINTSDSHCDRYKFSLAIAGSKVCMTGKHYFQPKIIPWPAPEADFGRWLATQVSVHFQCFLDEAAGADMYVKDEDSSRSAEHFRFPEWSEV